MRLEGNNGFYYVINVGIKNSIGKYIVIHSANDISFSNRIEKQLIPLISGSAKFTTVKSRCITFNFVDIDRDNGDFLLQFVNNMHIETTNGYSYEKDSPKINLISTMFPRDF